MLDYGIPLALITTLKRGPSLDQVNGTWFLWSVGSESVAVAAASLARVTLGHALAVLAVVCWAVGLMQYLLTAALVLAPSRHHDVVAPAHHRDVRSPVGVLELADPAPAGSGRLAARVRHIPLRYELGCWNLVFPVGMYAVTTHELGRATATSWMTALGRWEVRPQSTASTPPGALP